MSFKKCFALISAFAIAGFSFPVVNGCPTLTAASFKIEKLVANRNDAKILEPIALETFKDGAGGVNIFFTQREGQVMLYKEATKTVTQVLDVPEVRIEVAQDYGFEDGLEGVAVDENFETNHWVYLYYVAYTAAAPSAANATFQLARYKFDGTILVPASRALIMEWPMVARRYHNGGGMDFDTYGDLWIGTGDNDQAQKSSSCTSDLRGSILRIHPLATYADGSNNPGIGASYSIPAGNFGDFFSKNGFPTYSDPALVRPEIYAKGIRQGYSVTAHPTNHWVAWGECGPDHGALTEEHNLITQPFFGGYPYFAGNNYVRPGYAVLPQAPTNSDATCKGAKTLPPATPAIHSYQQACAMTGPFYIYDPSKTSSRGMPPNFNFQWLIMDINKDIIDLAKVAPDGKSITIEANPWGYNTKDGHSEPMMARQGPDGAIYIMDYGSNWFAARDKKPAANSGITRISYVGPAWSTECGTVAIRANKNNSVIADLQTLEVRSLGGGRMEFRGGVGNWDIQLFSASGTLVKQQTVSQGVFTVGQLPTGIYKAQIKNSKQSKWTSVVVY